MLIGLCGPAGCGKTTIAEGLRDRRGFKIVSFADPLYDAVSLITGLPVEKLKDRTVKERELPGIGRSPRFLLQTLGTDWGREMVSEDIWVRAAMARIQPDEDVVVPDVRFDNEAEAIADTGGQVFYVVRPGWRCLEAHAASHASERGVSIDKLSGFIDNSGLADQAVQNLLERIIQG